MESRTKGSSDSSTDSGDSSSELTVIEAIHKIARANAFSDLDTEKQLALFLRSWWSRTYNRPLKDPLLESYTIEELLYEFYDRQERELAADSHVDQDADRIETKKIEQNLDWAEEEEKKELEALRAKQAAEANAAEPVNPLEDPSNKEWMQKKIEEDMAIAKEAFGSDFGEDIDEDFNG